MNEFCKTIRKDIIKVSKKSGHGQLPSCFSVVEAISAIYEVMNNRPSEPDWVGRDIFILSKGHASLAHYCILGRLGYFDIESVYTIGSYSSIFGCHADRKVRGVEVATGSLGHGIGIAVGSALAIKIDKTQRKVYVLIGDGESNEGSVWEAVLVAVNLNLSNLTIIYDNNMSHGRGLQIKNPVAHFKGFGCECIEVDGHDIKDLKDGLQRKSDTVKVIVANTVKGYGCKTFIDDQYAWHRRSPNDVEFVQLMRELS